MDSEDQVVDLDAKLEELTGLRKKAEEEYGKLLTLLDQTSGFALPQETSPRLDEIKKSLNRAWDLSIGFAVKMEQEDRMFWRDVAHNMALYLQPLVQQQREFNSLTVHLFNEFTASVMQAMDQIRGFHNKLILYFQQIVPVVDTKNRETIGLEDKNVAVNFFEFQETMIKRTKAHLDMLLQEFGKRMETLQVDSRETQAEIGSLHTSLRSLHHLANALKSESPGGPPATVSNEYRYYHFEEEFRGSREAIKHKFEGYVRYYRAGSPAPVLDLGCGRGEFLELLKEASISGIGVDSNHNMVQKCREMGLDVSAGDLLEFLQSRKENSLGGIFCSQVVEHLPPDVLLKLIETAHARLNEGAPILLETVNVGSAFGFLQVYTKDLTHRTPIHPDTLKFLVAAAGFRNPLVIFGSPVPAVAQLKLLDHAEDETRRAFNENMTKLNQLLYGHQEYAVLAYK
jgi:O-antigen chain-terminating methyltransferase